MPSRTDLNSRPQIQAWTIRLRYVWLLATIGQVAFIYWSSDRTWEGSGGDWFPGVANFVHFVLYGGVAGFAYLAGYGFKTCAIHPVFWIWVGTAGFGLFDEIHQSFVPGRDFSLWDVVTDGAGAVFATTILGIALKTKQRNVLTLLFVSLVLAIFSSFIFPVILPNV